MAVEMPLDLVVAVGGDGTVHRVVTVIAETPVALGIIPAGTGNLLAGNLGIPRSHDRAIRLLISGTRRTIDVGCAIVDGKKYLFTLACGVGFDADVMHATNAAAKQRFGKLAYFATAARVGARVRNTPMTITIDGEVLETEAAQAMLANFGRVMAGVSPKRAVSADDGLFDVLVVRASGPMEGLPAAWTALRQSDLGVAGRGRVLRAQASEVTITASRELRVEVDGSVVGHTPVTASILPASLTVLVPGT
jgi:YegS/Rv2252/BmrU family lipid kinase